MAVFEDELHAVQADGTGASCASDEDKTFPLLRSSKPP